MSLRARLVMSVAAVLFVVVILGGALICWRANDSVRVEMRAALAGAEVVTRQMLSQRSDKPTAPYLVSLVKSFNGQRHIRALLFDARHELLLNSYLASPVRPAPRWVMELIGINALSFDIVIPDLAQPGSPVVLVLQTDSTNEIAEVWNQARDALGIMLLFCASTLVAIYLIVGHSLRFLSKFTAALQNVADGRYQSILPENVPPEFAVVARGFNRMVERLGAYHHRNEALQKQILTLQEEERAEVARDLHDEVGPHLFAANVDADAIHKLAVQGRTAEIPERAMAIRESVAHIQKYVKAILRQLRPSANLDFGLRVAVNGLTTFWQLRIPSLHFDVEVDDAAIDRTVEDAAYRIVQESINNAIRHGHANRIRVQVTRLSENLISIVVVDDGVGLRPAEAHDGTGLAGMAERARAVKGTFTVKNRREASGVEVRACLPLRLGLETEHAC